MSRVLPDPVRVVAERLADTAGGYLRNTVRQRRETCRVCGVPVDGYERCYQCELHEQSGHRLADLVAPMVYAIEPPHELDQMYKTMRGYKAPTPVGIHVQVVKALLAVGLLGHRECDLRLAGVDSGLWATVPSTKTPDVEHPVHSLVVGLGFPKELEVVVSPASRLPNDRGLDPRSFAVSRFARRAHVTLIDDSWVTGGRAQSIAASLRNAGAGSVSILTVARVLNPTFGPNPPFIRKRLLRADFDPLVCPWTGAACP